jgi:transcriptional regulator with XRE-family HTH domain
MSALVQQFGLTVRELRKQRGWSQEELAAQADINRSYLGEIERASAIPSFETIGKLAAALDKSPATLLARCE